MLPEIDLRGGLDPGRVMSVVDAVQVQLQDVVFFVLRFQRGRHHGLAQLAQNRLFRGLQDGNLGQLLRDRAGPLLRPAGDHVDDAGFDDPAPIDAVVLIKVLIFHRDGRVAEVGTDLFFQLDRRDTNALRVALLDRRAVAVDDLHVAPGQVHPAGIRQGGEGIGEGAQYEQQDQAADDAGQHQPVAPVLEPGRPAPRSPACRLGG